MLKQITRCGWNYTHTLGWRRGVESLPQLHCLETHIALIEAYLFLQTPHGQAVWGALSCSSNYSWSEIWIWILSLNRTGGGKQRYRLGCCSQHNNQHYIYYSAPPPLLLLLLLLLIFSWMNKTWPIGSHT